MKKYLVITALLSLSSLLTAKNENNENIITLKKKHDLEVIVKDKDKPFVLVACSSGDCGACHDLEPILEEVSEKNSNVKIVKVNVDKHPKYLNLYKIKSVPTFIYFKEGKEIDRQTANRSASELDSKIKYNFYGKGPRVQVTTSYEAPKKQADQAKKAKAQQKAKRKTDKD